MPGTHTTIRTATEGDQHAITRLVRDARLNPSELDWRRFVVADEGGRIVGCAQLKIHRHGTRELHLLAVEPERRWAGIGSRLVAALLDPDTGERTRGPRLLWARRGAQHHRSLAGAGRRSRALAPHSDESRHDSPPAGVAAVAAPEAVAVPRAVADETTERTETTEAADANAAKPEPDELLGELSRVMHAAAATQHWRIAEELERQRTAQVEAIKARTASEAEELRKTSQHNIREVDAWAKTATELIAAERVRRIQARREKLQAELVRQDVIVEREVLAVEAAVESRQAELNAFFSRLEHESDPADIARIASSLPSLQPEPGPS